MTSHEPLGASAAPQLLRMLWPGVLATQAIYVAARLGLADLVASGPKSVGELARATQTDEASLQRLLRALATIGVFVRTADGCVRQSRLSDVLRADHPQSVRARAVMLGSRFMWQPMGELETAVRTGERVFDAVFDRPLFDHLAECDGDALAFHWGTRTLQVHVAALVAAYDFSRFERLVDVGGGAGAVLAGILSAHLHLRGVLYDLPHVIAAVSVPAERGVADRVEKTSGDFFDTVPAGADGYLLHYVLHNWDDASALTLLRNCRRAIAEGGRLLIVDTMLTEPSDSARAFMDVMMMVLTGGRQRTEAEIGGLLRDAGFSLTTVKPLTGGTLLVSEPV